VGFSCRLAQSERRHHAPGIFEPPAACARALTAAVGQGRTPKPVLNWVELDGAAVELLDAALPPSMVTPHAGTSAAPSSLD